MSLDLKLLSEKLKKYGEQFQVTLNEVAIETGIPEASLNDYENGRKQPTGDEILILADYYKCDYKFFVSNEKLAPFEQTKTLFRTYSKELSKEDRWAIQEFLFLCECEEHLMGQLKYDRQTFIFRKHGYYYKKHGEMAASALRQHLNYQSNMVCSDIYEDLRKITFHVFRRKLENSKISGLYIKHPVAGKCILINYNEDIYRQRFTAAHEAAHAILDDDTDTVVSFINYEKKDLSEIRANTFASRYLMPPESLKSIPNSQDWDVNKAIEWANKLKVNIEAFTNALQDADLIAKTKAEVLKSAKIPKQNKSDPEFPNILSPRSIERRKELLHRGLSNFYVELCFKAYDQEIITAGRLSEILLVNENELRDIAAIFGRSLTYGD